MGSSLLGPRLFKIYVNNLPGSVKEESILLFADDTIIYYTGDHIESVVDSLNRIASEFYQWCIMLCYVVIMCLPHFRIC